MTPEEFKRKWKSQPLRFRLAVLRMPNDAFRARQINCKAGGRGDLRQALAYRTDWIRMARGWSLK